MINDSPIAAWRCYPQRYQLEGNQCNSCKAVYFPSQKLCACGCVDFLRYVFSGKGRLLSFTHIVHPPLEFEKMAPYFIGLIELDEGPRLVTQLTDVPYNQLKVGMRVNKVFRKFYAQPHGIIHYGLKFTADE